MDCSPPGSSVHGILYTRILEWVTISFSRVSSWPRDPTHISLCFLYRLPLAPPEIRALPRPPPSMLQFQLNLLTNYIRIHRIKLVILILIVCFQQCFQNMNFSVFWLQWRTDDFWSLFPNSSSVAYIFNYNRLNTFPQVPTLSLMP